MISILDFTLDENSGISSVRTEYRLLETQYKNTLTDRITYIFIELPKFQKNVEDLDGDVLDD